MSRKEVLDQIANLIKERDGFTLIAHVSPDGDTLGSTLALFCMLKKLGKRAEVICDDPVPERYAFLPYANEIVPPKCAVRYGNVISVDCADMERMGSASAIFFEAKVTVNIDHHATNDMYALINYVDEGAAAAGELVYRIVTGVIGEAGNQIATCLYTAIMTDTGNFAYSNTSSKTLAIASILKDRGVNTYEINRNVYRTIPYRKMKLMGIAICKMELMMSGKFGMSHITQEDMKSLGALSEDTEGIIDYIRDVDTVKVAALIIQHGEDTFKVSLRSKTSVEVGNLAKQMGGGGHPRAAGYTAHGSFETVKRELIQLIQQVIEE